jgi:hypothetical protein
MMMRQAPLVILSSSSHTRWATTRQRGPEVLGTLFQFVTTGKKNRGGHANNEKLQTGVTKNLQRRLEFEKMK